MKLRNKLIPLATVFATGAVVAPVTLTSCSAGGMVDLTNGNYAPSISKGKTEGYVADEKLAMDLWMAAVNENPQVLIQDKYWGTAIMAKGFADLASINATKVKAQVKNVSVKYVTVQEDEEDVRIPTVSMTFSITTETNWFVNGDDEEITISEYIDAMKQYGYPLYYPAHKYYYGDNEGIPGNIYSTKVYESTWENIPVEFFEPDASEIPTIHTEWKIRPAVLRLLEMDVAKLDWKYTVKYSNTDNFVFNKDSATTTKTYGSTFDRTFTSYYDLVSGSRSGKSFTNGDILLESEGISSYYLSSIEKDA